MIVRRVPFKMPVKVGASVNPNGACEQCADGSCPAPVPGPLLFNADRQQLFVGNTLRGQTAFLILGAPSFKKFTSDQINQLRRPGIITAGVNNSVKSFRPDYWFSLDFPSNFLQSIWRDPRIQKIVPEDRLNCRIFDSDRWQYVNIKVKQCPRVWSFKRHLGFDPNKFLTGHSVCWGNDADQGGARSVMLPALRILHHLGAKRVVLIACDFTMSEKYAYHFDQARDHDSAGGNNYTYRVLNQRFSQLRPIFEAAGFEVLNANPESKLEAFKKISFEESIKLALDDFGNIDTEKERTQGLYDKNKPGAGKGLKTEPTHNTFWNSKPVIPKLAHFIWLGSELPKMVVENIDQFRKLHPDWELKIWTEFPQEFPADLKAIADKLSLYCQKSDLFRLWLLQQFGGVYVDVDTWAVRSHDPLLNYDNFIARNPDGRPANGVFGARKGSQVIGQLIELARSKTVSPSMPRATFGPNLCSDYARSNPRKLNVLPTHYFCMAYAVQTALNFRASTPDDQGNFVEANMDRVIDDVYPFSITTWGIPAENMPPGAGRSSFASVSNSKIKLPNVTLLLVEGVLADPDLLENSLRQSLSGIEFGAVKVLIPDGQKLPDWYKGEYVKIPVMRRPDYNKFLPQRLIEFVDTEFCLFTQCDGFVANPDQWSPEFLKHDYIGAPWSAKESFVINEPERRRVGNGGFSIRSRKLLAAVRDARNLDCYEDRIFLHPWFEHFTGQGLTVATPELAARFSREAVTELHANIPRSFGCHGKAYIKRPSRGAAASASHAVYRTDQGAVQCN